MNFFRVYGLDYALVVDIDCSDTENWNAGAGLVPIGTGGTPFTGSFDGNNKIISGLFINRSSTDYVALFGEIEKLTLVIIRTETGYNVNMQTGNFGQVRDAYVAVRQGVPQKVLDHFWQLVSQPDPRILDLGCGTGISTRQLAARRDAHIVGGDIDEKMLEKAQGYPEGNTEYVIASADNLAFNASQFDAVTAFSALHWFRDEQSLREIRRVLKRGGVFFVVNNNDIGGYRMDFGKKLERLLNRTLPHPKRDYEPDEILKAAGFSDVRMLVERNDEEFSLENALLHIQSAGVWNEVPENKEREALELMKQHILENKIDGRIVRQVEVQAVSGVN